MKSLWIISRAIIKNRYFGVLDRKTNWIINLVLLIGISMLTAACMIDLYSKLSVINITYIIPKMAIMGGNILMIIVMMPLFLSSLYKCNYIRFFSTYPVSSICCLMGKMIAICAVPYMIFTIMMELILSIYGVLKDIGYINLVLNSICIWMWVTLKFIYIGIICITLVKFLGRINLIKQLRLIVQIFLLFITVGIIGLIRSINLTYVLNQDSKVYLVSNSLLFKLYIEKSVENELMALIGLSIILIVALSIIYF
ncbi:hypothetical protein [Cellulosilyticum ruminicola]|uniref:hypothetical protein n=1 Tax=Cellulosilyticum ruminicola TaxID=425254 RepID=UPI0006D03A00|nr:hypothetical protein [Cellulosilyticum ruminicola]